MHSLTPDLQLLTEQPLYVWLQVKERGALGLLQGYWVSGKVPCSG